MKKVILTKGLQASGKTSWAKDLMKQYPGAYKRISKDDLRGALDDGKWSEHNEQFILKVRDSLILAALKEGFHVIVDDTNLHPKHEAAIRELVKGRAAVEIKDFTDVSMETCIARDKKRPNYVGEDVIRSTYKRFLQPQPRVPVYNPELPDAIICDIDGTLALTGDRNPYDTEKCEQDDLNEPIAHILRRYADHTLLLVSGRKEQHRPQTERWLTYQGIDYYALYMRQDGDNRKDAIVKREIYEQHIEGRYNVHFVLDDRNQVVELWRSLGLLCLQVADGDY